MSDAAALPSIGRLVVWRHGRTAWNAGGRFQGQLDPPLDDVGQGQAARTAPHLAAALAGEDTVLVSSDLVRARDTAAALAPLLGVPAQVDERLREHGLGSWEGLTREEVAERHPEQYADWLAGRPVRGRGGEPAEAVARRALAAVADLPPVGTAVLVTHGGTAGRLVEALLGLGVDHRRVLGPLGNCNWSELSFQAPRWRLMRHNSTAPQPAGNGAALSSDGAHHRSAGDSGDVPAPAGTGPAGAPAAAAQDADASS